MLVGHLAVGFAAKRVEPRVSLGTLVMATMVADFLWTIFTFAGVEHVEFRSGVMGAANYVVVRDISFSHSLLMDAIWAALVAAAYLARRHDPRRSWLLFGAVLSHWPLDVVAHPADMPLAPGVSTQLGLGLWTSVPATLVVEGGLWVVAIVLYARATQARTRIGVLGFWMGAAVLTLIWYNNIAGPPPPNPRTAPIASFVFFSLTVAWAYWMNGLRPSQSRSL